jgi:hypothetical protein
MKYFDALDAQERALEVRQGVDDSMRKVLYWVLHVLSHLPPLPRVSLTVPIRDDVPKFEPLHPGMRTPGARHA